MKLLVILAVSIFANIAAFGQTVECPVDKVCVSRAVAEKALQDADTVEAQKKEIAVKDQAIADLKKLLDEMRLEYAKSVTEASTLRQVAVADRAIIELLLKNVRKKCLPFTICL